MENEAVVQNVEIEPEVVEVPKMEEVKTLIEGPKEPEKPLTLEESTKLVNQLTAKLQLADFILTKIYIKLENSCMINTLDAEAELLAKLLGKSFKNKIVRQAPVKAKKEKNG